MRRRILVVMLLLIVLLALNLMSVGSQEGTITEGETPGYSGAAITPLMPPEMPLLSTATPLPDTNDGISLFSQPIEGTISENPVSTPIALPENFILRSMNTFDFAPMVDWAINESWRITPTDSGNILVGVVAAEPLYFMYPNIQDVFLQFNYFGGATPIIVRARQSYTGSYDLVMDTNGVFSLFKQNILLVSAAVTLPSDAWQTLQLSIVGSTISISINGSPIISYIDSAPLPNGTVSIAADANTSSSKLQLDNLQIWLPNGTLPSIENASSLMIEPETVNNPLLGFEFSRRIGNYSAVI